MLRSPLRRNEFSLFLLFKEDSDTFVESYLKVNFDPVLVSLLREVNYLKLQGILVPEKATQLYQKINVYRFQTGDLELKVNIYLEILTTLLSVEKPLLVDRIERI